MVNGVVMVNGVSCYGVIMLLKLPGNDLAEAAGCTCIAALKLISTTFCSKKAACFRVVSSFNVCFLLTILANYEWIPCSDSMVLVFAKSPAYS